MSLAGPRCPFCGLRAESGERFCRRCDNRLTWAPAPSARATPFETDLENVHRALQIFHTWVAQEGRPTVRFLRAYRERVRLLIPELEAFREKYADAEENRKGPYLLVLEIFSLMNRPLSLISTELRPSVSMGIFLERWMLRRAAEDCLKECSEQVDKLLKRLGRWVDPRSGKGGHPTAGAGQERGD